MSRWYRTARVLLLGMLLLLEGCMFFTLRDELTEMERVHALTGRIFNQTRPETNVLLVLYQQTPGGLRISQGTILSSAVGQFVVEVPNGTFYLFAFEDLDNDLAWDGREPSGYYGSPDAIVVTDRSPTTLKEFDIHLNAPAARPDGFPEAVSLSAEKLGRSIVKIGQVVGFDDPILSPEYGNKGYWEPLTFIREVGIPPLLPGEVRPGQDPGAVRPRRPGDAARLDGHRRAAGPRSLPALVLLLPLRAARWRRPAPRSTGWSTICIDTMGSGSSTWSPTAWAAWWPVPLS